MTTCQHDSLGRRIYLISQAIRNNIDRLLKPFDLTREQLHLLKNLDPRQGITQRQIGTATGKSAANTTRILDRLEKKNLIVRRENPEDRRSQLVLLTVEGAELRREMSRLLEALSARIEENIDNQDMAVVVRVLGCIEANLLHLAQDPGD
jgi:DNA-binding MarR family transcriptional regulator